MIERPLRVGLVCPYSLDVPGGVQNHVADLARVLRSRGHDVGVLAPGDEHPALPSYVTTVGRAVPVKYNGAVARLAFGPRVAARTRRWLATGGFDVLHVHEPAIPSVSLLALWASDLPVVATFHSSVARSRAWSSANALLRPSLEKITARIAVSEAARETLVQHHGGEPVVIPNGVFCDDFERAVPRSEWSGGDPAVVFLGRVDEPRKGLSVLLRAFPGVLDRVPQARLLIAGRGHDDVLDRLPADVRDHADLLGQVSDADRARLLASATVYVAPHTGGESFGIVLVEAMAAGAPVVASRLPAFRAVLGDGAFGELVPVGDVEALTSAVAAMLTDPQRRDRLRQAARARARSYDWSRVVPDVEAVYETVVTGRGGDG